MTMNGSLIILDLADRAEADAFVANDPYAKAGLFEGRPHPPVEEDHAVGGADGGRRCGIPGKEGADGLLAGEIGAGRVVVGRPGGCGDDRLGTACATPRRLTT